MDLHLTPAQPSAEERAAVDSVAGAPQPGTPPPPRDLLLPILHAIQARAGWISPGAVNYTALRMDVAPAEIHGVASFYSMFSLSPRPPVAVHVCGDLACSLRGAETLCSELRKGLGPEGSPCADGRAIWQRSQCLGLCERAPAVLITSAGETSQEAAFAPAAPSELPNVIRDAAAGRLPSEPARDVSESVPQAGQAQLHLLKRVGRTNPASLADYQSHGGYAALARALELGPDGIIREVIESGLLGRGGAAFPAGKKWQAVRAELHRPGRKNSRAYVVCNADESEPGTFKDRIVMEGDPFAVLEGMTIAAAATGAEKGYIYIRGEYPLAAVRLTQAIGAARTAGLLGANILGSGLTFDIEVRRGAGAYICGEETALFNSIEGYRGEPRNKPPFPAEAGLFRQPTVVNNVETLINISEIILRGGREYARAGTAKSTGYRLFCVSGHVARPGIYEVEFGATLRQVIELAGGVAGSGQLQAVLLGGAAGTFVSPAELDTPLTFEGARAIGATLGSGAVMVFDDSVNLKQILLRIARFFRHETCGQCVPCRVGVVRQQEALERLIAGRPLDSAAGEVALLREVGQAMRDASICGLGQTASSAIESTLGRWRLFA